MILKNQFIRSVVLPLGDRLMGHPMTRRLRFLREAQWWPREAIERERLRLLQQVVRCAGEEVPVYRALYQRHNVLTSPITNLGDLSRFPVVTKTLLRDAYSNEACRDTGRRTYETSTSGSTGKNFWVREDHETAGWYRASFLLALEWAGWQIGEPHLQSGITTRRNWERRLKDLLLGCHYFPAYRLDNFELDRCLELLERKRIQHLWGYPSSLAYLSERACKVGFNHRMRSVVTWGDQLFPHCRRSIEAAFKARVHDTYGCGEGFQIAAQCGTGDHYHVHSLDVIVEFLDDSGQPVPEGQPGNLVITRLHAGPMPFIRYQVGDVGVSAASRACPCGRGFALMQSVVGRTADVVRTPSGNRLVVHFFTGVLEHFPEIDMFQAVQNVPDTLLLRIVPTAGYKHGTDERIRAALVSKGADLRIDIEKVETIPLSSGGKRRFVIQNCERSGTNGSDHRETAGSGTGRA